MGGKGVGCNTGGIAGGSAIQFNIENCMNDGKITAGVTTSNYSRTGGIVGLGAIISNCTNYGEVTSPYNEKGIAIGGISGYLYKSIHASLNVGIIKKAPIENKVTLFYGGLVGSNNGTVYPCNTHAGIILEADGTQTLGNPAIGYSGSSSSTPDCPDKHTAR